MDSENRGLHPMKCFIPGLFARSAGGPLGNEVADNPITEILTRSKGMFALIPQSAELCNRELQLISSVRVVS